MAFIKNNNLTNSQPLTDVRNIFIGRTKELDFFKREILQLEDPTYNSISIWGNAGVGKSTLLTKFIDVTHGLDFKDYCLTAHVDERQATPASIMEKFADQLRIAGYPLVDFEQALRNYKDILRHLRTRQEAGRETFLQNYIFDSANSVFKDNPSLLANPVEKTSPIIQNFEREYRFRQLFKDFERIDDPLGELTTTFISDLKYLANSSVALSPRNVKHRRKILLFFDSFDQLAADAIPWLLNYFLEADINSNVVLVAAGRMVIERSIQSYQRRWQKYKSTIYPILLDSFTEDETRDYLIAQGITGVDRISTLLRLSGGLPYSVSLLTSNSQGEVDLTKDVVDNFLGGIPEHEEMKRQLALEAALLTRPFNQDDLEAFSYLSVNDRPIFYRWLCDQPFVRSNPQDGRHAYHDLARDNFSRHLCQDSPNRCQSTREALAHHYQHLLEKIQVDVNKEFHKTTEWLELVLALVHQLLLLPAEESHITAIQQILEAYEHTNAEQDGEVIRLLRGISEDDLTNMANTDARWIAKYLIQYIESNQGKREQELLAATSFFIEKLEPKVSSKSLLLAHIYSKRGNTYASLKKYQQAIADFNQALKYNASYANAYISRGQVYYALKRYDEALIDFDSALEINSNNQRGLIGRGQTYQTLKRYEEALRDFDHAIELDKELNPIFYMLKGQLLYIIHRYEESAASLIKALRKEPKFPPVWILLAQAYQELYPHEEIPGLLKAFPVTEANSASVIVNRAEALNTIDHYEEAIVEFTCAIELEPQNIRAIVQRGRAYDKLECFEEAINDFTLSLKLKNDDVQAFINRGQTYNHLKRYTDAMHDFTSALGHKPNDAYVLLCRSETYKYMRQYREALRDLDRVMELDKKLEHQVLKQKGEVLRASGRKEEALNAFLEALKTKTTCRECWRNLAVTYEVLEDRSSTAKWLRELSVSDISGESILTCCADALKHTGHYEEALMMFTEALTFKPNDIKSMISRGQIYCKLGCYTEAFCDYDRVIKRHINVPHEAQEQKGKILLELGRNEEALNAFLEALKTKTTCRECWRNLAVTYEVLEDRSSTAKWLRELSVSDISGESILTCCADALKHTGHYEEALMMFTEALTFKPNDIKSMISRGQIYCKL